MQPLSTINVGLVDPHILFRKSLVKLIHDETQVRIQVLFDVGGIHELQNTLAHTRGVPSNALIFLVRYYSQYAEGMEILSFLKNNYPLFRCIVITNHIGRYQRIELLKRGIMGYVTSSDDPDVLMRAIATVSKDGTFIPQTLTSTVGERIALTDRQINFLQLCISELTYREISDEMCLSPKTIENYREELFRKLNVSSRTGLALRAIEFGLNEVRGV